MSISTSTNRNERELKEDINQWVDSKEITQAQVDVVSSLRDRDSYREGDEEESQFIIQIYRNK